MFNRVLLIFLCSLSLIWILFVGYDVFYKTDRLNPELIFHSEDKELLIINRTDEFFDIQTNFEVPTVIQHLADKLIQTPRNERIFISKNRPIILIESPHYWNKNSVSTYLTRKGIVFEEKEGEFYVNDFRIQFKYHFLLIAPETYKKSNSEFILPSWDKQASVVIIQSLANTPYITEVYKQENGQIIYQTTFENKLKSKKIDDKNVFAPYLPVNISNYHFYEKEYAISNRILPVKSPMADWINYGFVIFTYQGSPAIITDIKLGEDPFNTFNTQYAKDTNYYSENTLIKKIPLLETFAFNSANGFYATRVGDKIVLSGSLDLNKTIVADYELGNTLLFSPNKAAKIYGKLPSKVSERIISSTDTYAISLYANTLTKYVIQQQKQTTVESQPESTKAENHYIVTLNGTIKKVYGKNNQQYILTSSGQLLVVNNNKTVWSTSIDGELKGSIKFIDFEGNGKNFLLFNTDKKVYLLSEQGTSVLDDKILPQPYFLNEVNFYRWKNQSYLIYSDKVNQIKNYNVTSNTTKAIAIKTGVIHSPIVVFIQNNRLIGVIAGEQGTQTVDLGKNKSIKLHPIIPSTALLLKNSGSPFYIYSQKDELSKLDYASGKTKIGDFKGLQKIKITSIGTQAFISFISNNKLFVYDENGSLFKQIAFPISDVSDYDITIMNGKLFASFLDGLENKIIICDEKGAILKRDLEGKNSVFLSSKGNSLNVISEGNGYAVQYYNVLTAGQ